MKAQMRPNLGHLGSKTRSLGKIKEIPCGCCIGSCSIDLKISQNVCLDEILDKFELGHLGSKTRSLGQIKEKPCGCSRGHISCSVDLKIGQNVCIDKILDECEFGSPPVINWVRRSN